jgi:hypothetical protein
MHTYIHTIHTVEWARDIHTYIHTIYIHILYIQMNGHVKMRHFISSHMHARIHTYIIFTGAWARGIHTYIHTYIHTCYICR